MNDDPIYPLNEGDRCYYRNGEQITIYHARKAENALGLKWVCDIYRDEHGAVTANRSGSWNTSSINKLNDDPSQADWVYVPARNRQLSPKALSRKAKREQALRDNVHNLIKELSGEV